jgi:hypothetical protein
MKSNIRWVKHMEHRKRIRNVYKSLVEESQGRPKYRWKGNNIKMDGETGCEVVN